MPSDAPPPADFLPFLEAVIRRHLLAGRKPSELVVQDLCAEALSDYGARVSHLATADTAYARAFRAEILRRIHVTAQLADEADEVATERAIETAVARRGV